MDMWFVTICVGFALEVSGLGIAARGLWRTWRDNAEGRPFLHPRIRAIVTWFQVHILRRKPEPVTGHLGGVALGAEALMTGFVSDPINDDMTLAEQVQAVQRNALAAMQAASHLQRELYDERRERERSTGDLLARMDATERSLTSFSRTLVVEGVPLAVVGLSAAGTGLLLQAIASIATW